MSSQETAASAIGSSSENNAEQQTATNSPMVHRIKLEVGKRDPDSVKELVLDNCGRVQNIEGLTDAFINLRVLSIVNVGLSSLVGFPSLPSLKKLVLSDNRLSNGLEHLEGCSNLAQLDVAGNKFKSLDDLKPLTKLSKLVMLDVMNCELTSADGYTQAIFDLLPQLKYLDNVDKDGNEREESDGEDEDEEEDDDEERVAAANGEEEEDEEEEEYEEDDSKTGLKALYDRTIEDDDNEEDYIEGANEEEEDESDEEDDESEAEVSGNNLSGNAATDEVPANEVSTTTNASSTSAFKGQKRKRASAQANGHGEEEEDADEQPPLKV